MSGADRDQPASIGVRTANPAIRIEIIDGKFETVARGYGWITEIEVPPGLYVVRYFLAGTKSKYEMSLWLEPGERRLVKKAPLIDLAASMDKSDIDGLPARHLWHVMRHPIALGAGAELFLFARDGGLDGPSDLFTDMELLSASGRHVADLGGIADERTDPDLGKAAGVRLQVDPGYYRLRRNGSDPTEMGIHACPGWQTQLILTCSLLDWPAIRQAVPCPDFETARLMMIEAKPRAARDRRDFGMLVADWLSPDWRQVDSALRTLAFSENGLSERDVYRMLAGGWSDPMVGILGLHLLLRQRYPNFRFALRILGKLRAMMRGYEHPDVEALALRLLGPYGNGAATRIEVPPMLRASWHLLMRASGDRPDLLPAASFATWASENAVGTSPWLIWHAPDTRAAAAVSGTGINRAPEASEDP